MSGNGVAFVMITEGHQAGAGASECVDMWSRLINDSDDRAEELQENLPFLEHAPGHTLSAAPLSQIAAEIDSRRSWTATPTLREYVHRGGPPNLSPSGATLRSAEAEIIDKEFTGEVRETIDDLRRRKATRRQATFQFLKIFSSYVQRHPRAQRRRLQKERGKEGLNPNSEEYRRFLAMWEQSSPEGETASASAASDPRSASIPLIVERSVLDAQISAAQYVIVKRVDAQTRSKTAINYLLRD